MLHNLIEYADSHGISGEEGFTSKRIRFLLQFSPQGEYLTLFDYGKTGEDFSSVPHLQFSGDKPFRQFLVDTIDFLTLYHAEFETFKKEADKLLATLKKEADFGELKEFSEKILCLLAENNYSDFQEKGSVEEWAKILKKNGRDKVKVIDAFLENGGPVYNIINSNKFNLFDAIEKFKKATELLLDNLKQETDFGEIRSFSDKVMSMLLENRYLELREGGFEKKWKQLLKQKGRGAREDVREFLQKKGIVDDVFDNEEFKLVGKHQFCLRLLEQAGETEPLLGTIANALADPAVLKKIHNDFAAVRPSATSMNNATFAVINSGELTVFAKTQTWRNWWKAKHSELSKGSISGDFRCFLSGKQINPRLTHPKIKGLGGVGGKAETSLVSFDKGSSSLQSYGFSQGENAAISSVSAEKYSRAINHLINCQHHQLAGSEVVYWYSRDIPEDEDIIKAAFFKIGVFEEDDDDVNESNGQREAQALINAKEFLRSVVAGERHDLQNVQYYAMTLQGNQGRAVVQNWMEGKFVILAENIEQWFSDLEISRISGIGSAKPPKIETLVTCLLKERKPKQKYADWIKPVSSFRDAIWRVAIGGSSVPFPVNTVRLALLRLRESTLTDEWANALDANGEQMGMRRTRLYARIGLIKAFLIRNIKQEITMEDREDNRNSVYWLGSLFAVLADLQRAAHQSDGGNNVKATIVDRFYTTASTCPKLVHGRLIAQSQHHLRKLENKNQNAAIAINREIASINQKINFNEVPNILPLPEQSWFALGYYQQIAEMNSRKAEAFAKKKSNSTKGDQE